jgi:hypothetical protein
VTVAFKAYSMNGLDEALKNFPSSIPLWSHFGPVCLDLVLRRHHVVVEGGEELLGFRRV